MNNPFSASILASSNDLDRVSQFREPIRKPGFKTKYRGRRDRNHAMKILARVVKLNNKFYWIDLSNNEIGLEAAMGILSSLNADWSKVDNTTDAKEFFTKLGGATQITRGTLDHINLSIELWARRLGEAKAKEQFEPSRSQQLDEVDNCRARRDFIGLCIESRETSEDKNALILDARQEEQYRQLIRQLAYQYPDKKLRRTHQNVTRVLFWLGGSKPVVRFVHALLSAGLETSQYLDKIDSMDAWLKTLSVRLMAGEKLSVSEELKQSTAMRELLDWLETRGLIENVKGVRLEERLARYLEILAAAKKELLDYIHIRVPRVIAAWALSTKWGDRLHQPLVDRLFDKRKPSWKESLFALAKEQVCLSSSRHYPKLVEMFNQKNTYTSRYYVEQLLDIKAKGASDKDIFFCNDHLQDHVSETTRIVHIRHSSERFQTIFGEPDIKGFLALHGFIHHDMQVEVIDTVLRWVQKFPENVVTPKIRIQILAVLKNLLKLVKNDKLSTGFAGKVYKWASRAHAIAECFPDEASYPKRLRLWLRRLGYYQNMCDARRRVPKALLRVLNFSEKQGKELAYLKAQIECGSASASVKDRYLRLKTKKSDNDKGERKNIRTAQESCLLAGLAALTHLVSRHTEEIWTRHSQRTIDPNWSDERRIEMAEWVCNMDPRQLKLFKEVWDSFEQFGIRYEASLNFNQKWLHETASAKLNVQAWLNPQTESVTVGNKAFKISVCKDPGEIFMMGTYFGTCLGQGGCNEMSVLSVAAHANKQVIYLHTQAGKLMARMLIAINRKNALTRYTLYLTNDALKHAERADYCPVVEEYCLRLAQRIGIVLSDTGAPLSLGGHFWYDDGTVKWSKETITKAKSVQPERGPQVDLRHSLFNEITVSVNWDQAMVAQYVMQPQL